MAFFSAKKIGSRKSSYMGSGRHLVFYLLLMGIAAIARVIPGAQPATSRTKKRKSKQLHTEARQGNNQRRGRRNRRSSRSFHWQETTTTTSPENHHLTTRPALINFGAEQEVVWLEDATWFNRRVAADRQRAPDQSGCCPAAVAMCEQQQRCHLFSLLLLGSSDCYAFITRIA